MSARTASDPGGPCGRPSKTSHRRRSGHQGIAPKGGLARVILFYKPYGVLSQFTERDKHPGLSGFDLPKGVYPVGRLDHDSEGLLMLTDDGILHRRLTEPRFQHRKTYWAQVERVPTPEALAKLAAGPRLGDGPTRACEARLLPKPPAVPPRVPPIRHRLTVPDAWIEITITEGRNRQVRRMTAAVGHPTLRLIRCKIGRLSLQGLEPGRWRQVSVEEALAR